MSGPVAPPRRRPHRQVGEPAGTRRPHEGAGRLERPARQQIDLAAEGKGPQPGREGRRGRHGTGQPRHPAVIGRRRARGGAGARRPFLLLQDAAPGPAQAPCLLGVVVGRVRLARGGGLAVSVGPLPPRLPGGTGRTPPWPAATARTTAGPGSPRSHERRAGPPSPSTNSRRDVANPATWACTRYRPGGSDGSTKRPSPSDTTSSAPKGPNAETIAPSSGCPCTSVTIPAMRPSRSGAGAAAPPGGPVRDTDRPRPVQSPVRTNPR